MKIGAAIMVSVCLALSALAAARVVVPSLPEPDAPDAEAVTNFPLTVNAERLERLTVAVSLDPCVTNEVIVAIGADADDDGDLSIDEADVVFGCDCGAWYRADLRTGETMAMPTNALVVGKRDFDPSWNLAKAVRRGFGEMGESVSFDEERVRFNIRIR